MRITLRWRSGKRRWAVQASKSSRKQRTAARHVPLVDLHEVVAQDGRQGRRGRFVARSRADRDVGPARVGHLAPQVAHPIGEAPLPERPWKAGLPRPGSGRAPRR
jgi:hypothetical protein